MLKFSDGETFDTAGDYRVVSKSDGYYVIGKGMLIPVKSEEEAQDTIEAYKKLESLYSLV